MSSSLWAFALEFYGHPGIEPLLLALQDEDDLDVPVLITLLYAGLQGLELAEETVRRLLALAEVWQGKAIAPLRMARRALKTPAGTAPDAEREALRAQVKTAEREAERLLLMRLETLLPSTVSSDKRAAISTNLGTYLACLKCAASDATRARLATLAIAAAAFS